MTVNHYPVHTFYYTHNSFPTMIKSLHAAGVKDIELYGSAPLLCEMYTYTEEEHTGMLDEKKNLLDQEGICVRSIFIPTLDCPINIADENKEVRDFSISFVKKYIDDAKYLNAPAILLDSGYGLYDKKKEPAWKRSVEALKEITKYAGENNIIVYLRPMGTCTNLVNNAQALEQMLSEVAERALKPCLDAGIMMANGESVEDYTSRFENIQYIRVPNFGPDGEICDGVGLDRITSILDQMEDFNGDVVVEIGWERLDIPDTASVGMGKIIPKLL